MCLPLLRLALLLLTECGAARLWPPDPPATTGTAPAMADQQRLEVHTSPLESSGCGGTWGRPSGRALENC